jgi:DegV family protein with EDD domain
MDSKIVVDSGIDFNEDILEHEEQIGIVPFKIIIDDKEYIDKKLNTRALIEKMKESKNKILTACPSPNDFLSLYNECKNTFVVTISSKLSGSYNSAMVAKEILKESIPDNNIHVFDCKSASAAQTLVTLKVKQLVTERLSYAQIVEKTNQYIDNMKTYFVLESLDNLVKNGRISNFRALIGTLIHIVPIMGDNGDGEIVLKEKVRGQKKAFSRLIDMLGEENIDFKNTIVSITHVNAYEKAIKIKEEIEKKYSFKDILVLSAGGISTVYADDGGIVIAY